MVTTIQLKPETKARLDDVKLHPRETYDETLNRLLDMAFDPEPLSEESMRRIEEALEDIRAGRVRPFEEYVQERGL
jgi:predicted transcriptional regulator